MKPKSATKNTSATARDQYKYLEEVIVRYENKWVALSSELLRLLAAGDSLKEVRKKLHASERKRAVFHWVKVRDHRGRSPINYDSSKGCKFVHL